MYTMFRRFIMFDKKVFSEILIKIYKTYNNQRDFANAAEVNRAYLSQYMNEKLENPPTPKILQKIANASNNITTYEELMQICGYNRLQNISRQLFKNDISDKEWNLLFGTHEIIELDKNEQDAFSAMLDNLNNFEDHDENNFKITFNSDEYTKYGETKQEKDIILRMFFYFLLILSKKLNNSEEYSSLIEHISNLDPFVLPQKEDERFTPKARAIARDFDRLPPDKQKLYTKLLNSMLEDEEE